MENFIIRILLRFITPEKIGKLVAGAIAKLLNHAKDNRGEAWDTSKAIIKQIQKWSNLFLQVYDDDNMTTEEEKIIADEISKMTDAATIGKILKGAISGKKQA